MYDELVERLRAESYTLEELSIILPRAADAIEELQGRAKVLEKVADKWCEAVPKWIPVTERLPENEVTVLVVRKFLGIKDCPAKTYVETAEYCYGDWVSDSDEYKIARSKHTDPLYWMPLPEPPKEETHDNN